MSSVARDHQIRPRLTCTDGFSLSVQASSAHYSAPREDHPDWHWSRFECVEVGYPEDAQGTRIAMPDDWLGYADNPSAGPHSDVFAWVPVQLVWEWIQAHGGLVADDAPPAPPEPEATIERLVDHVQALGFIWVFDSEGRIAFTYADLVNHKLGNPPCLWAPEPHEYRTAEEWLTLSRREIRDLV